MANFFGKIYNLFRQPTRRQNLNYNEYIPYFHGSDDFPLTWHKAISESPSGTSCVSTIQDFLEGSGFAGSKETGLEKKIVNAKGETFFQIHQQTVKDFGEFEGFAWRFMFDALGRITEWYVLPFENCRLGKPDSTGYISKILYNPYFGTSDFTTLKQQDTCYYDAFDQRTIKEQLKDQGNNYKGQVLFFGTTTALSRFYPLPAAHSAIKWMKIESGVSDYHEDNINNGFLQSFMLLMKGNPNEPINNPEASDTEPRQTVAEAFDELVSNNFMGAKRIGNMFVYWVTNPDEKPEILPMPSNNNGDLFVTIDNQATKKITIAFKVPSILANINEGVSLGGDGNTVRVAVKLMQQRSKKPQRFLTDAYQMIWKYFSVPYTGDITITPYNPYPELEVIDEKIWNVLSEEEQRLWIDQNTEIELMDDSLEPKAPPQARLTNSVPVPFPENVRAMVKKALDYQDKMGLTCGGKGGREVAEAILNNQNLGLRNLKRIHSYLKKRPEYASSAFNEGCNVLQYAAWGGKDMEVFLETKLKELDAWLN